MHFVAEHILTAHYLWSDDIYRCSSNMLASESNRLRIGVNSTKHCLAIIFSCVLKYIYKCACTWIVSSIGPHHAHVVHITVIAYSCSCYICVYIRLSLARSHAWSHKVGTRSVLAAGSSYASLFIYNLQVS